MQLIPPEARCAVHPSMAATGTCARCGSFVCAQCLGPAGSPYCEKCRQIAGDGVQSPPPWERRAELGLVKALIDTIKLSVFEPQKFWATLPADGPVGSALLYAWLIGLIQAVPAGLVQMLNFQQMKASLQIALPGKLPWLDNLPAWGFAAAIVLPVLVLFPLTFYLSAGMVHLGCKLWGAGDKGFNATARVLGYAQGPLLVGWIPLVGFVAIVYLVVLQVMGITRVHQTTGGKATLGILTVPILLTCCLSIGAFVFVLTMLRGAGMR